MGGKKGGRGGGREERRGRVYASGNKKEGGCE